MIELLGEGKITKDLFPGQLVQNGLSYDEYFERMAKKVKHTDPDCLDQKERNLWEYTKLNYQRSSRIQKTYTVSDELRSVIREVREPQLWMVLTEDWCGDSAQTLPYIAKMAEQNEHITLSIFYRDDNPHIMDQHLTNGTRGIPKLVGFDENGSELFQWGPRPREAAQLFRQNREEGFSKQEIYPKLHLWYGKDRGKSIEAEFRTILSEFID